MINCQKFNLLLFLTLNSVTTGVRELNGTSQISLVTHDAKGEMRDLDEVLSGLARMLSSLCFSAKYWTGHRYFIHKMELYCVLTSKKKINTRLAFVYYSNGNEMDQMVRNDIACICIPIIPLFGTHTFHFNCFFEDFNCVFTQIRCLSRVLPLVSFHMIPVPRNSGMSFKLEGVYVTGYRYMIHFY